MTLISYAQNFEDIRLWRAFGDVSAGRYLDIGAQDPVQDSVSRLFYERGWRGVSVEPTPAYAEALRAARPDETVVQAAVSAAPGPLRFFELPGTGLSTGKPEIAQRHIAAGWSCREITVPTVTLASLFDLMGDGPIHWLKVDVEGMEGDLLASWGDHPARPAALVIEATEPLTRQPSHAGWAALLEQRGYRDVAFDGLSRFFIHEGHAGRGEALALAPNVFDDFHIAPAHFAARALAQDHAGALAASREEAEARAAAEAASAAAIIEGLRGEVGALTDQSAALAEEQRRMAQQAEVAAAAAAARAQEFAAERAMLTARLDAAAEAHAAAQAEAGGLRAELVMRAEAQAEAAAAAQSAAEAAAAAIAALEARLAAQAQDHAERVAANAAEAATAAARMADLGARREELVRRLARTQRQLETARAALSKQAEAAAASAATLAAERAASAALVAEIRADRDRTRAALTAEAAAASAAAEATAHALAEAEAQAAARERLLEGAARLIAEAPSPLAELPPRLRQRVGKSIGTGYGVAAARHADAAAQWLLDVRASGLAGGPLPGGPSPGHPANGDHAPAMSLHTLLAAHDRAFVHAAYRAALGRAPDPDGEAYYLARLRSGAHKLAILGQLRRSPEGRKAAAQVDGLDAEIRRHARANMPVLGPAVRLMAGGEADTATARHLRAVANELGALRQQQLALTAPAPLPAPAPAPAPPPMIDPALVYALDDLLHLHDAAFVARAYGAILKRAPEPDGLGHYLARVRAGVSKVQILHEIRHSPEGRAQGVTIRGLGAAHRAHRLLHWPLIGDLLQLMLFAGSIRGHMRDLRSLDNRVNQLAEAGQRSEHTPHG